MKTNENVKNINNSIKKIENNKRFIKLKSLDDNLGNNFNDIKIEKQLEETSKSSLSQETQRITILDSEALKKLNENEMKKSNNQNEEQNKSINNENSHENLNNIQNQSQNIKEELNNLNQEKEQNNNFQDKKDYRLEKILFNRINVMQGKIKESLELIKKFERINAKEGNLPNIITTLHDKLTQEVIKQFRTVGIEFNMNSFLVQAIVSDLLNKFGEGITEFKDCSENLNFVREVQEDFESRTEIAPTSKVKNIFARLRGIFKPERKQERLEQLERERQEKKLEEANIHLIRYKFINSELEKYTIKNNIIDSLTREMMNGTGIKSEVTINSFIQNKISAEMAKLGLSDLIPSLEENLYNIYKNKYHITELEKDAFLEMKVNELKKGRTFKDMKDTENDIDSEERIAV